MSKTMILTLVLVVMVLVSAVQAYQLTTLKTKIENNELTTSSRVVKSSTASSGGASVPSSLQNLPQMVGGC